MQNDAQLRAADIAARQEAVDPSRSFIVQAPAGSGKTELLIQRYLKLLTVVDQPEEILAITFTRKAALEMRHRVTSALERAVDDESAAAEHEALTISIAKNVLDRDVGSGWNLLRAPGRMRIETVDAFNASVARSLPVSSGLGGSPVVLADASIIGVYQSAAAATLDWLTTDDANTQAVELVLAHLDGSVGLYVSYLTKMLATREQWLGIVGRGQGEGQSDAARNRLERNIARVIETHLQKLVNRVPEHLHAELRDLVLFAGSNLRNGENPEHPLAVFDVDAALPGTHARDCRSWQAIVELLLVKNGNWRRSITKKDGFPAGNKQQKQKLYDLIEALRSDESIHALLTTIRVLPEPHYTDQQWEVLLALFNVLPLAVAELQQLFAQRGVSDHAEIALAARSALGSADQPGDVTLALDYRIKHLLIDETQDTSIGQYDLLKTVTAGWTPGDGRTVFCVGDPMQSIYRFRDAEVGEFLLARRNGIGTLRPEPLWLRRNFRSGENLVHWFNTVFSQIFPLQDDVSLGAISYTDSVPVESLADQGRYVLHPLFAARSKDEAEYSANVIQHCLADNPRDEMAVLVRSRTQLPDLLTSLRERGIPYQAIEIDRLTDLPEIVDVTALARALSHPFDRLAWLALLRGPWSGLDWADLHALARNDTHSTVLDLMLDKDRLARLSPTGRARLQAFRAGILPFCERNAAAGLRDVVERAWFALAGPALLDTAEQIDNVYRFFAVLEKIEIAGTLEDIVELEVLLDEERVSSAASHDCRLRVMTMHKAKGLQFDHVLLHGLGRHARGRDSEVLSWLFVPDDRGENEMIISPVGSRSMLERDPLHQFIVQTEANKEDLEQDRLLYVACTRAKKSLHLVGSVAISDDGAEFKQPHKRSLLRRLWPAVEGEFGNAFQQGLNNHQSKTQEQPAEQLVKPLLRRLDADWEAPQIPDVPGRATERKSSDVDNQTQVHYYWVGALARHGGTIVHRWLQRISDRNLEVDPESLDWMKPTTARWARSLGVADHDIDELCARVIDAVAATVTDAKGRWLLYGAGQSELQLTGLVDGELASVAIDRIRIDDDGTHWIVDYKTSTHEGGDLPGFLDQESARYRPQLEKYAALYSAHSGTSVRTALYFPLLREFCEVKRLEPGL